MSDAIETLSEDLKSNLAQAREELEGALVTSTDVAKHLLQTLWPFLENVVENLASLDEELQIHIENADDILQPETAETIANALATGLRVAGELGKRLKPGYKPTPAEDDSAKRLLVEYQQQCQQVGELISAITVEVEDEDDGEPDEDDEDEGDEDDDNHEDSKEKTK